jgi:ribosomal protein L13E
MQRDTNQDVRQDGRRYGPGREAIRLSVPKAAERLGITQDAVRKRVKRGYIEWEKDEDGRLYVWVDPAETAKETSSETSKDIDETMLLDYVETLKERIRHLEDEARRKDHLLAAALEKIPAAIEPPQATPDTPRDARETPSEPRPSSQAGEGYSEQEEATEGSERRSWWRRLIEG